MWERFRLSLMLGVLVSVVAFPHAAQADPIVITAGGTGLVPIESDIVWSQFAFGGSNSSFTGFTCCAFSAYQALTVTDGVANVSVGFPLGTPFLSITPQVVHGVPYSAIAEGSLSVTTAPFVLPQLPPEAPFMFSTPFSASGHINGYAFDGPGAPLLFSVDVTGSGIETIDGYVHSIPPGSPPYYVQDISLAFEPTPEPASLLLVGTGLLGVAVRRWRTHRRRG